MVIQPDIPARTPAPEQVMVEGVGIGPPPHGEAPPFLIGHYGPVAVGDGRALLQETRVADTPARVAMDTLVDVPAAPPGSFLELGDGELRPAGALDDRDQVRLPFGELRLLATGSPVQQPIEPACFLEVLVIGRDAGHGPDQGLLPLHEPQDRVRLDQVEKHLRVPPVGRRLEPDPVPVRDGHIDQLPPDHLPHGPADQDFGGFSPHLLRVGQVPGQDAGQHPGVLLPGIIDPAGEHPVEDLVIPDPLHLRHPPDAPLRDDAQHPLPVLAHRQVVKRLAERGGDPFQDLGHVLGECPVVQDDHRPWLQALQVEESLVAHPLGETVPGRDLLLHRGEGVALALPALTGDRDVEAVRVQDGAGCKRHDHALGHHLVALVVQGKRPEHRLLRVPVLEGREGLGTPRNLIRFKWWSSPGSWCGCGRSLRSPAGSRLILIPEFLPPLGPSPARCMLAAGRDSAARELDGERPVLVSPGERAGVEDEEGAPLVRFLAGYPDPMVPEPASKIDRFPLSPGPCRGRFRGSCRQRCCQPVQQVLSHHPHFRWDREEAGTPVRPFGGVVPLPGHGAVQLPDPGGVVVRSVDRCRIIIEQGREDPEAQLHQIPGPVIVRQLDPVQEVSTVPRVGEDRVRPSHPAQVVGHTGCGVQGSLMLLIGRGDPARPGRVHVHREPSPGQDVGIGRSRILLP
ncbi:hypothetical protein ASZ90_015017 [hydrocarbon metagenome]|uniref:Uncharacterized protein n=1 Tax=hydrocarbon metagenome TaxID=938273 RepID=A0A0W8F332_9ZZZZ